MTSNQAIKVATTMIILINRAPINQKTRFSDIFRGIEIEKRAKMG